MKDFCRFRHFSFVFGLRILSFSEKCKNQGSFCKCFTINKVLFLHLTEHGGNYENADHFFNSRQKFCEVFSQNRFTSAFLLLFATAPTTTATAATRPQKRKKLSFRSCKRLREMVYYL